MKTNYKYDIETCDLNIESVFKNFKNFIETHPKERAEIDRIIEFGEYDKT